MHLRSLSLRNYRVYRELEFPDGLVGIYGPNGSGKSTLIESIRYALYGDSRTDKAELRSAGVREDLRVELVFEHEGNTYDVRRRLKGLNLTPEVEVYRNGQLAVQSVREANAFVGRVLGMDQRAFLASVCAQQKELTAFTGMVPSDRRRLVLDLLGVSPVERALAKVREEARGARDRAGGARAQLPDLPAAEAEAAEAAAELAAAESAEQAAATAEQAARAAQDDAEAALAEPEQAAAALAELRNQARLARAAAAAAKGEAERHEARAAAAAALDPEIEAAETLDDELAAVAAPLAELERAREAHAERQGLVRALDDAGKRERVASDVLAHARRDAAATAELVAAREAAEAAVEMLEGELEAAREHHNALGRELGGAAARLEAAREAAEAGAGLDPGTACPTCGQPLGDRYAEVRRHRDVELAGRRAALDAVGDPGFDPRAHQRAKDAAARRDELATQLAGLRARRDQAEQDKQAAKEAHARADEAEQDAVALDAKAAGQDQVAALEEEAGYLARLADLLAAFRLHLVSRLGRRLSAEAATLFGELTDNEYQDLVVDPEDYAIRVADDGTEYELSRFSGSESDLASLSLRVAVSLVIAEGAGELGLLVLDEVLGALDRERRERVLAALTALSGRFRQVLLVTHNDEVKDLLPAAIEVHKGPHRTSTVGLRG